MKIGNINIGEAIVFAPMAGFSDVGFRYLCRKYGADLTYTEMISAKGLYYNNSNSKELLLTSDIEKPVAVQLFGSECEAFLNVIDRGLLKGFDIIDINMGCPVRKIVTNGEGSAMMLNIPNSQAVVKACKSSGLPVSVKIRSGYDTVNATEFAIAMQDAGADCITVHARTREQFYTGNADWNVIRDVKSVVNIPVIGNGDVKCYEDIARMKEVTGCDGVMIGRAALGNPYIFSNKEPINIKQDILTHINMLYNPKYLKSPENSHIASNCNEEFTIGRHTNNQFNPKNLGSPKNFHHLVRLNSSNEEFTIGRHINNQLNPKKLGSPKNFHHLVRLNSSNEEFTIGRHITNLMKKHLCFYGKHIKNIKEMKLEINKSTNLDEIIEIINKYF